MSKVLTPLPQEQGGPLEGVQNALWVRPNTGIIVSIFSRVPVRVDKIYVTDTNGNYMAEYDPIITVYGDGVVSSAGIQAPPDPGVYVIYFKAHDDSTGEDFMVHGELLVVDPNAPQGKLDRIYKIVSVRKV